MLACLPNLITMPNVTLSALGEALAYTSLGKEADSGASEDTSLVEKSAGQKSILETEAQHHHPAASMAP